MLYLSLYKTSVYGVYRECLVSILVRGLSCLTSLESVVLSAEKKLFSCFFLLDVLCSFRKGERFGVMDRCMKCSHYFRFLRVMAEEDEKVMDEIDRMRRYEPHG